MTFVDASEEGYLWAACEVDVLLPPGNELSYTGIRHRNYYNTILNSQYTCANTTQVGKTSKVREQP